MTRLQVPAGFCPSKADRGLAGRKEPLVVGGQTEPIAVAASSSRVMLLKLSWKLHTGSMSTTVVPAGDLRLTRRSPRKVWLTFSPTRSISPMVSMPAGMERVEVTVHRSQMVLGTLVLALVSWQVLRELTELRAASIWIRPQP